ncbi:MAG: hypothetical protein J0H82_16780 [Alphaproteobacteria bacterium]|jgi:hypothetical protein|nr:hypothetical protein [Alphaproteobacteria bacterium]
MISINRIEAAADLLEAIAAGGQASRAAAVGAALTIADLSRATACRDMGDAAAIISRHLGNHLDLADRVRASEVALLARIRAL